MTHMTKKGYFLLSVLLSMVTLVYTKSYGKTSKQASLSYDERHVEKLPDFKNYKVEFKKVGEIKDISAVLFDCWDNEPGDFSRIEIKLRNKRTVVFDNCDGWIKVLEKSEPLSSSIADYLKVPEQSGKVQKQPYCVTLDMGVGRYILILFGYPYAGAPGLLTLIHVSQDKAELIFNKEVKLLAISETENGYRLLGQLNLGETLEEPGDRTIRYPGQKCELFIEHGELSFKAFPAFKRNPPLPINYDKQYVEKLKTYQQLSYAHRAQIKSEKIGAIDDPPAEIYHAILCDPTSTSGDARLGDFSKLYLHFPSDLLISFENFDGGWVGPTDQIKLPHKPKKVKKHRYGITLDVGGGNRILILTGARYTSDLGLLTLIFVGQDNAEMIFNRKVELLEVREIAKGFRLLGQLPPKEVGQEPDGKVNRNVGGKCELLIEDGELTFKEL